MLIKVCKLWNIVMLLKKVPRPARKSRHIFTLNVEEGITFQFILDHFQRPVQRCQEVCASWVWTVFCCQNHWYQQVHRQPRSFHIGWAQRLMLCPFKYGVIKTPNRKLFFPSKTSSAKPASATFSSTHTLLNWWKPTAVMACSIWFLNSESTFHLKCCVPSFLLIWLDVFL